MLKRVLFCLLISGNSIQAAPINYLEQLKEEGFVEVKNPHVIKKEYNAIYETFELVIAEAHKNSKFAETLKRLEKEFQNTDYKEVFCGAPAGCYRDCTPQERKFDNKKYFQFSSEFHTFVRHHHGEILEEYPLFRTLLTQLENVDSGSKKIFGRLLTSFENTHPTVLHAMYGNRGKDLTVITKVLSYDPSAKELGTAPHYDKSGLTLILDNDDAVNDRLVLSAYQQEFDFSKLKAPTRQFENSAAYSSALFIVGSLLQHQSISIQPTPHAVLPFQSQHNRHSLISFALLPHIDMTGAPTMIVEKKQLMRTQIKGECYAAAKVIVTHPETSQLLLVNRQIGDTFGYEAAGGRVNVDFNSRLTETFEECAIREAQEELGLKVRIKDYLGSYAFFWESEPHTCTHCVVYLANPVSDLTKLQKIGDTDGNPVRPEWIDASRILNEDLLIRSNHRGLKDIFKKAALALLNR